jgi:glutamyl-tRNA synthetase
VFVRTFEEIGYLPEALVNYMALVGWSYDDKTELMTRAELIERFSLERVNSSPAAWNYDKLNNMNGLYIRQLTVEDLTDRLLPFLSRAGLEVERAQLLPITPLIQERIQVLSDAPAQVDFFFSDDFDYEPALLIPKKSDAAATLIGLTRAAEILSGVEFKHDALDTALRAGADELGLKVGQMFQPIRVAVCGRTASPPLLETLEVLGRETSLKRVKAAIEKLTD